MVTVSEWWMWPAFAIFVMVMLLIDLFVIGGRKAHIISTKEALGWTLTWFALALLFNVLLWLYLRDTHSLVANQKALEFLTGYFIEKSLSLDNIFVILMIFNYFAIPAEYQRRILLYGVIGAIVLRLILILIGVWMISQFAWVLYIFGIFLVITGVKMFIFAGKEPDLAKNPILIWMRRHLRITEDLQGERFFVWRNRLLYITPLFLVLVLIEFTDLIFAVDSIPAIFSITSDPFIVYTSNIFALLGLRALYFLLVNAQKRFIFLKYGLAVILIFIGCKMLVAHWIKIPITVALGVVFVVIMVSILLSHRRNHPAT